MTPERDVSKCFLDILSALLQSILDNIHEDVICMYKTLHIETKDFKEMCHEYGEENGTEYCSLKDTFHRMISRRRRVMSGCLDLIAGKEVINPAQNRPINT